MQAVSDLLTPEEQVAFAKATLESKTLATKALENKQAQAAKAKEQARLLRLEAKKQAELKKVQYQIDALTTQKEALQASKPENSADPIFNFIETETELAAVNKNAEEMFKLLERELL
ncbi:MAG: hypothetical protein LW809_07625 [Vampirovibrionales bacterium]|jgi:hypothetical protein|nr:hypothetical protein [Vampirovibrionales bacterium]